MSDDDTGDDDTGRERVGGDDIGDDDTGDDDTGDDDTGDKRTGDERTGDDDTGDRRTGDEDTGEKHTGDDSAARSADAPAPAVRPGTLRTLGLLVLVAICVRGFYDASEIHGGFHHFYSGIEGIPHNELALLAWYGVWGSLAVFFTTLLFTTTTLADRIIAGVDRLLARPAPLIAGGAFVVFVAGALVHELLLLGEPITDDENVYVFIAQTLLEGRIKNPLPDAPALFHNQFIVLDAEGWYGKYPIGHPLLLALGEAVGLRFLIVPLLGALNVWLTYQVGKLVLGPRRGALVAALLLVSPQFVLTHGTQLSQPTSCAAMLLAIWATLRLTEAPRPARPLAWAALAGAALGFGVLVRPFPGALFVLAAPIAYLGALAPLRLATLRARVPEILLAGALAAAGVGAMILINKLQTGNPLESGYQQVNPDLGFFDNKNGQLFNSVGGAIMRQSVWLFGWPVVLLLAPFARFSKGGWVIVGFLLADYAYRVIVPKTVVSSTGPIYVFEAVPLLVLLTVAGAVRVRAWLARAAVPAPKRLLASLFGATVVVSAMTFLPVQLVSLHDAGAERRAVYDLVADTGASRAVVFADFVARPLVTWAYYPPSPDPSLELDEDVLFLHLPREETGVQQVHAYWRSHLADRRAFLFRMEPDGGRLFELPIELPPLGSAIEASGDPIREAHADQESPVSDGTPEADAGP